MLERLFLIVNAAQVYFFVPILNLVESGMETLADSVRVSALWQAVLAKVSIPKPITSAPHPLT